MVVEDVAAEAVTPDRKVTLTHREACPIGIAPNSKNLPKTKPCAGKFKKKNAGAD